MATAKQLDDIMECPICTEVYTDPRLLPCVHTYCLKCITEWSKDKQPGDKLACPLCRKEFTLSSNGVEDLPKNFFVSNFLQIKDLSSGENKKSLCEACSGDGENDHEVQNVASVYCVECQMKLCKICERGHKTIKLTRSHRLIDIGVEINVETLHKTLPPSYCDQHEDEYLKIYCIDCKAAICMMCYIKSHNGHRCSEVKEVVDDFRKQMAIDVQSIATGVDKCSEMLESLDNEKKEFSEQVEKVGVEITEKCEQLKRMIDSHKEKLINELSSMKQKKMKEIDNVRDEIERQLLSMESYKKYVDEVRQKGTACDIARAASSLHDRVEELLKFDVIERMMDKLGLAAVMFAPSDFMANDASKTVGHLKLKSAGIATTLLCAY